jgi:hypothetical protein
MEVARRIVTYHSSYHTSFEVDVLGPKKQTVFFKNKLSSSRITLAVPLRFVASNEIIL